jgi:ribonuclease HII
MSRSLIEILRKIPNKKIGDVFIDWNDNYIFEELERKPIFVIGWDWKIAEIWAASIVAKVFRDKLMSQYSILYPDLLIENHKWYWTKKHKEYLSDKSKVTSIHRLSFKPIKKLL